MTMSDKDLIESLGGATKLAARLGPRYSVQRVQNWKERGIPPQVRLDHPDLFPLPSRPAPQPNNTEPQ